MVKRLTEFVAGSVILLGQLTSSTNYRPSQIKPHVTPEIEAADTAPFLEDADLKPQLYEPNLPETIMIHKRYNLKNGGVLYKWEEVPTGKPKEVNQGLRYNNQGNEVKQTETIYEK